MPETKGSPQLAPAYALHRHFLAEAGTLVDTLPVADAKRGINMAGHHYAHVQVVPGSAGVNPSVSVLWWSEAAGAFVREHTALDFAGVGDGVPYEFTVPCRGRRMFVAITGGLVAAEVAEVYVAGFDVEPQ